MNKPKLTVFISMAILSSTISGCATSNNHLTEGSRVLTANDELIRFAYELGQPNMPALYNFAKEHCLERDKLAAQGLRTCDGDKCEITYFCENQTN